MICMERVRTYCYEPELIENYDKAVNDTTQSWDCHHRLETIMNCGWKALAAKGCFYHRPAHELIFLTRKEHTNLHHRGAHRTDEAKKKMSAARRRRGSISDITRKRMSKSHKGLHWYTDGTHTVLARECPKGFHTGRA